MKKKIILPLKGTRDFYPDQMFIRNWLYETVRQVSESFGYEEYDAPFLESLELYAAKSGEELVKEQSFVFQDRGGNTVTLRPELTPSLARMIAARQQQLTYPLRWWSWGPMWRYEQTQRGRKHEFFQWNIDMIGANSPEADAEMVTILATFFNKVGLTPQNVAVLVNDRRLVNKKLEGIEVPPEKRPEVLRFIDRREKMKPQEWDAYGIEIGLTPRQLDQVKAMLDDNNLWQQSEEMERFFVAIQALGMSDYVRYDPSIVRGLAYYTGIVFEAMDISGYVRRAILGGGRYDNLMADVGGDPLPATGFALGDVVIELILENLGLLPKLSTQADVTLVTVFDEASLPASYSLATYLRREGLRVACYPEPARLPKQFKYADRMGMRLALVLGPDEQASGKVTVKDLSTGEQQSIDQKEAADYLKKRLVSPAAS